MGGDYYCRASGNAVFEVTKPHLQLGIGIDALPDYIKNSKKSKNSKSNKKPFQERCVNTFGVSTQTTSDKAIQTANNVPKIDIDKLQNPNKTVCENKGQRYDERLFSVVEQLEYLHFSSNFKEV